MDKKTKRDPGGSELLKAVLKNDYGQAAVLLAAGVYADVRETNGMTPLMYAASWGYLHCIRLLIGSGADVNAKDSAGWTALHWGVWYGNTDTVLLLIQAGSDVNIQDRRGETPLHCAALRGYLHCMRLLIEAGADPAAQDNKGRCPWNIRAKNCIGLYPGYEKELDILKMSAYTAKKLKSEDTGSPAATGFEFDI